MANERTPQQIIGDDAFNQLAFEGYVVTRPAAPVEGLETVAYISEYGVVVNSTDYIKNKNCNPLVTRSQAEAIIAAERAMRKTAEGRLAQSQDDLKQSRANNAALTARVKELSEALEPFAKIAEFYIGESEDNDDTLQGSYGTRLLRVGDVRAARAALEASHD